MTSETLVHLHGVPVLACAPDGPVLCDEHDAVDLIGEAYGHGAELVLIPAERFTPEFFILGTRLAGEIIQGYRLRLVIVGNISGHLAQSSSLRDFVYETNRGSQVWFVATAEELDDRLRPLSRSSRATRR
jgi:hypothetical protein